MSEVAPAFKPKKSVALSGVAAGNTALCTVGRSGNDLHYRGYDILDVAASCEFEEIAYLLIHGKLPNRAELAAYAVFLFVVTRQRWRVARYVAEAVVGTRRNWRFHTERAPRAVSRWRLARAYVAGACRGLWTTIEPTLPYPARPHAARLSRNAKRSPLGIAGE